MPINPNKIRAVIYSRVSSEEQKKKEFSIPELQIPKCRELIEQKGWMFIKTYIDEARDGNTFQNREDLQKMLIDDIDTYDVIVVYSFDRLVRDDAYTEAEIYKILDWHRKQVTSVMQMMEIIDPEQYDPKSLNVATHRRFRGIQVAYDSLTRRERFMQSKEALVNKGKPISEAPYGYEMVREVDPKNPRRTIGYRKPNDEEALILRRIFKERDLEGKSCRQIAIDLNEDGIRTRNGKEWAGSRINRILRNPFPCGYFYWHKTEERKYGDERIRKNFPEKEWKLIKIDRKQEKYYRPLISKKSFDRVQKMRQEGFNRAMVESSNVLAGLIKCPLCGATMVETSIYKAKNPPHKRGYYQCSRWPNQKLCSPKKYPSWPLKEKVMEKAKAFLNNPEALEEYFKKKDKDEIKDSQIELKTYEKKMRNVREDIKSLNLKYLKGKIKDKYYDSLLQELEEKEAQLQAKYITLKDELDICSKDNENGKSLKILSRELKGEFDDLSFNQIKLILRVLIKEILPSKTVSGKGVKADPRISYPITTWNNPATMELECIL